MSYLVLARKYRPKNFAEMVGQEHVVQALSNALTQQRLHHAYLFTGTRGVGKTTVSRILAKSLNCVGSDGTGSITAEPCGQCEMCRAIDAGRFVDYTELDAASNRGVDEVQQLLEQAVYKPVQGRFKVFMIDEVHMLTNTAFNAMLKTLEEPPEYLKFVLATTDPQKVPVTVLSRCLQFNLRPMAPETILAHLKHVLALENLSAEEPALRLISRAARGSMRDALSLTDQAIAFGGGQLQEAALRQMLGAVDSSYVLRLIEALAVGDGTQVLEIVNTMRSNGLSAASTLEDMATCLQRMAVCQQVPGSEDVQDSEAVAIARLAALMPADETQLLYSIAIHGRSELGLAPDEYTGLTMSLLRLLAFKPKGFQPAKLSAAADVPCVTSISQEVEKKSLTEAAPTSLGELMEPPKATPSAQNAPFSDTNHQNNFVETAGAAPKNIAIKNPVPASVSAPPAYIGIPIREQAISSTQLDERITAVEPDVHHQNWLQIVQQLLDAQLIAGMPQQLAVQSQCVEKGAAHMTLRISQSSLKSDTARDGLQNALQALGRSEAIVVEIGPVQSSWAMCQTAALEAQQKAAEELILNDDLVKNLIAQWGAKIVPGSIKVH